MAIVGLIPRRIGAVGHALLSLRVVDLIFQRKPGTDGTAAIAGLNFAVQVGTSRRTGVTGNDGKITIVLPANGTATVTVMGTQYRLTEQGTLEAINTLVGTQRRLQMLGYFAGTVDGRMGESTEYAVLNFQADNAPLAIDGLPGPATRQKLRDKTGA